MQKEHNALKEDRDADIIELDFVKKHHVQDHDQVDCLLKSEDQIGIVILKYTLSSQQQEHANCNKIRVIELQDKAKEKSRDRSCKILHKSAHNGEKRNCRSNCNSSIALGRAERVVHCCHQDLPSLHEKDDTQSHVEPESRSSAKRSGLTLPKELFGNKVSRQKKDCVPREHN